MSQANTKFGHWPNKDEDNTAGWNRLKRWPISITARLTAVILYSKRQRRFGFRELHAGSSVKSGEGELIFERIQRFWRMKDLKSIGLLCYKMVSTTVTFYGQQQIFLRILNWNVAYWNWLIDRLHRFVLTVNFNTHFSKPIDLLSALCSHKKIRWRIRIFISTFL